MQQMKTQEVEVFDLYNLMFEHLRDLYDGEVT